jgi:hypothetical protein
MEINDGDKSPHFEVDFMVPDLKIGAIQNFRILLAL